MTRTACFVLTLAILAGIPNQASAGPMLTLSSPADLTQLTVGIPVTIDVTLQGLPAGNFIFNLQSQVLFPSSLLQLVSGPTPSKAFGAVFFGPDDIADPQLADFNAHSGALASGGGVFGNFLDETANGVGAIGQNGLYYSFVVTPTSPGSGTIGFDLDTPNANRFSGTDSNFAFAPLPTGSALAFTILAAPVAVPEPSSLALFGLGALGLAAWRKWRKRDG